MPSTVTALRPTDTLGTLADIAAGLVASLTGEELALDPDEPRAFVRLLEGPTYEAWLITWAPMGALELHDHGGSIGAIHVVGGELIETHTDRCYPEPLRTRRLRTGDTVTVPATRVHEVWNAGPAEATSVHVYSPRVTSMTFFDSDPDRFLTPLRFWTAATAAADLEGAGRR